MGQFKLHCFICGHQFKNRDEVWRSIEGKPICEDCMGDYSCDCDEEDWLFTTIRENGRDARNVPLDKCEGGCGDLVYHAKNDPPICWDCYRRIEEAEDEAST